MRADRIVLGVGRHHPLVSLQFEIDMLPVKREALRRGVEFWVQVMRMNDDRLAKVVMLEALEIESKVKCVNDLQQSLEKLGWRGLNAVTLDGDNKGSETTIEGYTMAESKSSLEGEGKGEFKVRNDCESYGQGMQGSLCRMIIQPVCLTKPVIGETLH